MAGYKDLRRTRIDIYILLHRYLHTCIHACMHACIHTYTHTYIRVYISLSLSLYIYIYILYIYIYKPAAMVLASGATSAPHGGYLASWPPRGDPWDPFVFGLNFAIVFVSKWGHFGLHKYVKMQPKCDPKLCLHNGVSKIRFWVVAGFCLSPLNPEKWGLASTPCSFSHVHPIVIVRAPRPNKWPN